MNKTKFVIIAGESASGKDSVLDILVKKYGYHKMVSYTTRPPRKSETNGYDYFFLDSNEEFNKLLAEGVLFEKTEYQTATELWMYGLGVESVKENETNVVVLNPHGIQQLKALPLFKDAVVVYITAEVIERVKRYLNRDNVQDCHKVELIDRLLRDDKDFTHGTWSGMWDCAYESNEINTPELIAEKVYNVVNNHYFAKGVNKCI